MDRFQVPTQSLTDADIDELLERAVHRLATIADPIAILIPEPEPVEVAMGSQGVSGWCEIGKIRDARNRFWYRVLWHPASGEGRLLRERPRMPRDSLGRALPIDESSPKRER